MSEVRILHIITGLNYGGAEKITLQLCKGLKEHDHKVWVVGLSEKSDMLEIFINNGIDTKSLHLNKNPFSIIQGVLNVRKLVKKERIHLIHAHMTHAMVFSVLLKLTFLRIPVVFTPHSIQFGSDLRRKILKWLKPFRKYDILFSREQYRSCFKRNYRIIPNGIDIAPTGSDIQKYDSFTFLSVGRLEGMKNHSYLIPLVKRLNEEHECRILIAGDGSLRHTLQNSIDENNLQEKIKLLGFRKDIFELCQRSHAFVLPSLWEGMPVSILEAGMAKLPVIATNVGSIPSIIDEATGYLCDLEGIYDNMKEVIENYGEAKKKGEALYIRITDDFSVKSFIQKHMDLYFSVIR